MSILNPEQPGELLYRLKVSNVSGSGIQNFQLNATLSFSLEIMTAHTKKALGFSI